MFTTAEIDLLLINLRQKLEEVECDILSLEQAADACSDVKVCEPRAVSGRVSLPAIEKRSNHRRRSGVYSRASRFRR